MRPTLRSAILLTVIAVVLHITLKVTLVSLLPLPVLLSMLFVWLLPTPGYYLITLAVVGELFAGLPPGITTAIVFTPIVVFRMRSHIHADVSVSFFLLLMATCFLQLLVLALAHLWPTLATTHSWQAARDIVPWPLLGSMLLANSFAAWLCCIVGLFLFPPDRQPSSLFEHRRYAR